MAEHFTITRKENPRCIVIDACIETRFTMAELCSGLRELGLVLPDGDPPPIVVDPDRLVTRMTSTRTTVKDRVGEIEHTEERFTNKIHFRGIPSDAVLVERCPMYWGDHNRRCIYEEGHEGQHKYAGTCGHLIQSRIKGIPDLLCPMPPGHYGDCHG